MDVGLALAGLFVGAVVGLTGMGGGALMTPVLVIFFQVPPLAAVSSDLVASAFMKPVGGLVHLRNGTVHLGLVKLLVMGSVPSAFAGALLLRSLGDSASVQGTVKALLGVALLLAAVGLAAKAYVSLVADVRRLNGRSDSPPLDGGKPAVVLKPARTIAVGVVGGLVVGLTSVGSGSLMIVALLALYPQLSANRLVGTDLVQAVPLVASAAVGHYFFGDFHLEVAASLLVGAIPGVYVGARFSSYAPGWLVRRALTLVLLASGLKLLGMDTVLLGVVLGSACVIGPLAWALVRMAHGLPPFTRHRLRRRAHAPATGGPISVTPAATPPDDKSFVPSLSVPLPAARRRTAEVRRRDRAPR